MAFIRDLPGVGEAIDGQDHPLHCLFILPDLGRFQVTGFPSLCLVRVINHATHLQSQLIELSTCRGCTAPLLVRTKHVEKAKQTTCNSNITLKVTEISIIGHL